ncbi:MAG: hypothetical protein KGR48_00840 [Alphaproteobacteria bacterium]|nr:hypothetical protein [Alphaproteobacteria bacterium]MDE2074234.1 hypothetical protein [Alphaproteobacteria bacterium]MDE2352234.1 hypothetical protein [Alphaproteobacteria bacterium]
MNWKRGFFRIWLIASGLFVIAVSAIYWQQAAHQFEALRHVLPANERSPELQKAIDALYRVSSAPASDPHARALAQHVSDLNRREIELRDGNPWQTIYEGMALAIAVPLILLALGAAAGWALGGFGPRKSN